jgi:hypothetical protein
MKKSFTVGAIKSKETHHSFLGAAFLAATFFGALFTFGALGFLALVTFLGALLATGFLAAAALARAINK